MSVFNHGNIHQLKYHFIKDNIYISFCMNKDMILFIGVLIKEETLLMNYQAMKDI